MTDIKSCKSCGMPMRNESDFGGGHLDNKYCVHCTDIEGNLKPYEEVFENMKIFAIKNMGISETEAFKMVEEGISKLPAWKNVKKQH